ncbi:TPA: hypothetical protein LA462_000272 [Clostridium botulinum]|nr:hypothetical protein [Clostridium botulinum]
MSTNIDVYKIPVKYKDLDYFEDEHLEYEDDNSDYENLVFTIGGFDSSNIITGLFDITYSKQVPWSGRGGLFEGKYIITLEEFLKAKELFNNKYDKSFLIQNYEIEEQDFNYIHEQLERFFETTEPIIKIEKRMYFRIG